MRRLLILLVTIALPAAAHAYPQFQFSTGAARCNQCHIAPAGGGLLTSYGREESADTISQFGGNGGVLHGLWTPPSWFAFSIDYRSAAMVNGNGATESPETAWFPMQFDLYTHLRWTDVSATVFLGAAGYARDADRDPLGLIVSREHYLMWRPKAKGPYARVGRFFAPFGLRMVEHTAWVRRYLGFHSLEETYNVSAGWVEDGWEAHATAFTADFIRANGQDGTGVALYAEKRLGARRAVAAQARLSVERDESHTLVGGTFKEWLPGLDTLVMAELDVGPHVIDGVDYTNLRLAGYLGLTHFVTKGITVGAAVERFDSDARTPAASRNSLLLSAAWFPIPHLEAALYGRFTDTEGSLLMLQLHYYL